MNPDSQVHDFVRRAEQLYESQLKDRLEAEHLGRLIALDPDSGEFVLGNSFRELESAALEEFGTRPTHIFRIGGGGAVRIGVGRDARETPTGAMVDAPKAADLFFGQG